MLEPETKPPCPAAADGRLPACDQAAARGRQASGDPALAAAAGPCTTRLSPRQDAGLDPSRTEPFTRAIEAFRRHHAGLPGNAALGGLFVLDLGQLRRRFVNRWPGVAAKAHQLAAGILGHGIGPNDLYVAASDDRYLVLVTDLDRATAERQLQRLAGAITERLCGRMPGGVAARVRRARLDLATGLADIEDLAGLEARLASLETAAPAPERASFAALEPEFLALWTPVVNLKKRLISAYALAPSRRTAAGPEALPAALTDDESLVSDLDRWAIAQAAEPLASCRAALVLTLHYASLATMRHREPLLLALRRLPRRASRRLVVELAAVPDGLPQARLHELAAYIRPLVAGLLLRIDRRGWATSDGETLAQLLVGTGIKGLAFDLGRDSAGAADAGALAALARQLHARSLAHVGTERQCARAAFAAGFDHVAGPALLPAGTSPGRAIVLPRP